MQSWVSSLSHKLYHVFLWRKIFWVKCGKISFIQYRKLRSNQAQLSRMQHPQRFGYHQIGSGSPALCIPAVDSLLFAAVQRCPAEDEKKTLYQICY